MSGMRPERGRETLSIVQLVPSLLTILGLCAGLTCIRYVFVERYDIAAILLIFAAAIDGLDGLTARRLGATSLMGAELDSLSDFVCFGIMPALLVFQFALTDLRGFGWATVLVYAICACLRLARFNVNRDTPPQGDRAHFVGVPAPAGALLALLPVFLTLGDVIDARQLPIIVSGYLGLVGVLMISTLPTFSPKALRIRRDQAVWVLTAVALLVGLLLTRLWLFMALADLIYLIGLMAVCIRRRNLPPQERTWTPPK